VAFVPEPQVTKGASTVLLCALTFGNFMITVGVLSPAAMLGELSQSLNVTIPVAGLLSVLSGIVLGIGGPIGSALTARMTRRRILCFCLILFAIGHALSALAPNFTVLLLIRVITLVTAGIFGPQAAATVSLLAAPAKRARAISLIFIGSSLGIAFGIPLCSFVAVRFGWRVTYSAIALMTIAGLWLVARSVPARVVIPGGLPRVAWQQAFSNPKIRRVLATTLFSAMGQFTLFGYLAPTLTGSLHLGPNATSSMFMVLGVSGIVGNLVAARFLNTIGIDSAELAGIVLMACGIVLFGLSFNHVAGSIVGVAIWGFGAFAANSIQQGRVAVITPKIASASIALNQTAFNLGQASGAGLGGILIAHHSVSPVLAWAAASLLAMAAILSVSAAKLPE
jgi:MFS transporter, DHA1 family, inner membrane transport protein